MRSKATCPASATSDVVDYNRAVDAWTAGGRDAFEAATRATACIINGTTLTLLPRNGSDDGKGLGGGWS